MTKNRSLRSGAQLLQTSGLAGAFLVLAACQTAPVARSGFLTNYDRLPPPKNSKLQWRDDGASDAIQRVYIAPAVLAPNVTTRLSEKEKAMVLHEVDRQICFEVSKRFAIVPTPSPDAGTVRTAIVRLRSASRLGSAASAVGGFFIPVPVAKFRVPFATGGLAIESEMLAPGGKQASALIWTKNAGAIGRVKPSLSRAGDAIQLSEPLGDAIGKTFASEGRPKIEIGESDPCAHFGPRKNIARALASGAVGFGTGLYMPQVAGTSVKKEEQAD
jgi:hypothetical protein